MTPQIASLVLVVLHLSLQVWFVSLWDLRVDTSRFTLPGVPAGYLLAYLFIVVLWSLVSRQPLLLRLVAAAALIWFPVAAFTTSVAASTPIDAGQQFQIQADFWFTTMLVASAGLWIPGLVFGGLRRAIFKPPKRDVLVETRRSYSVAGQWMLFICLFAIGYALIPVLPVDLELTENTLIAAIPAAIGLWIVGGAMYVYLSRLSPPTLALVVLAIGFAMVASWFAFEPLLGIDLSTSPTWELVLTTTYASLLTLLACLPLLRRSVSDPLSVTSPWRKRAAGPLSVALASGLVLSVTVYAAGMPQVSRFHRITTSSDPKLLLDGLAAEDPSVQDEAAAQIHDLGNSSRILETWAPGQKERLRQSLQRILLEPRRTKPRAPDQTNKFTYERLLARFGQEVLPFLCEAIRGTHPDSGDPSPGRALAYWLRHPGHIEELGEERFKDWCGDEHPGIRRIAAEFLLESPQYVVLCATQVAAFLEDPDELVRVQGAEAALAYLPDLNTQAAAVLREILRGAETPVRDRAAGVMLEDPTEFEDDLVRCLAKLHPELRLPAITGLLADFPQYRGRVQEFLALMLADERSEVRSDGILLVWRIFFDDDAAVQRFVQPALDDPDSKVRAIAEDISRRSREQQAILDQALPGDLP